MKYAVRVVIFSQSARDDFRNFIRQMAMAGGVDVHIDNEEKLVFDILCTETKIDTLVWAERVAQGLRVSGFNAAAAPEMPREHPAYCRCSGCLASGRVRQLRAEGKTD